MKTMNMISRRSFLKAAMAAATVSALGLTGCGSSASSTASGTASSAAASSAAASEAGQTFKVGIVNYVDHASLNQIVASVEERLDEVGKEKGVTFDYADYYANAQADQTNLNQIGADLVADGVDVIVAVATPTAATMLAAVEDTDIPVVYSAVTDPAAAGFDTEPNITGTSDALNTDAIMNLILAVNPDIDTIGLLYDLSQDASTQAIADAKAFCDSKKRIVAVCAVCALVPILNSAFYALNSSYYARWYYMPVLILAAMTVNALEDHNTDLDTPARGLGWIMLATLAFALVPVLDNDTGTWSLGVLKNPGQYFVVLGFGLGGLLFYRLICQKWRADSRFAQRMTAAVVAFACVFSMVHIGIGKFGQWYTDSDLVEQDNNALLLKEDLPEGDYRVDTYKIHDNIGMWLDKSCLQYFGSTAAPSILSFYPALGVKRDVRSEPELSNYALRGLLSVEYLITTPEQQADFESQADDGWAYYDELDGFVLYKNKNYVPMGFTYDYYVTEETYGQVNKNSRANLLMRALVFSDEDAAVYGKYLAELPNEKQSELTYDAYVQDCANRRAQACSMFQMNNAGFHAEITLENANLVFFSVPYDDGFTAYVNGEQTDIVRVDDGMMAVLCPAGTSSIDFVYQADGLALSRTGTLAALPVWLVYTAYFVWRKRKKSKV
jgi:hypothetical protein